MNRIYQLRREALSWQAMLVLCFFLFFFLGILVANGVGRVQLLQYGKINEYYVDQLAYLDIKSQEYLRYLSFVRMRPYTLLVVLGFTWLGIPALILYFGWYGFSLGYLFVNALVGMGLRGMGFLVASFFPQILCYIPAYFWLMKSMMGNGHNRLPLFGVHAASRHSCWKQLLVSVSLIILGIWLESICSPVLIQTLIRKMM